MLPAAARVRSPAEHRLVARRGKRVRRGSIVVSLLPAGDGAERLSCHGARAGVVVGRPVGGAVVRSRVKRRLREVLRARLASVPAGSLVVVRALAGADAPYAQLDAWVGSGLTALTRAGLSRSTSTCPGSLTP